MQGFLVASNWQAATYWATVIWSLNDQCNITGSNQTTFSRSVFWYYNWNTASKVTKEHCYPYCIYSAGRNILSWLLYSFRINQNYKYSLKRLLWSLWRVFSILLPPCSLAYISKHMKRQNWFWQDISSFSEDTYRPTVTEWTKWPRCWFSALPSCSKMKKYPKHTFWKNP